MGRKLKGKVAKGKGLKASLVRVELLEKNRQQINKKAASAKDNAELKKKSISNGKKSNKKGSQKGPNQKAFIPFEYDKILLLVGEGDFSYAMSIVSQGYISPKNLIATSFDSEEQLSIKYPDVQKNIDYLKEAGVKVFHDIDATELVKTLKVKSKAKSGINKELTNNQKISYVMFNFPHTGKGMKDVDRNIRLHQELMMKFFLSIKDLFNIYNEAKSDFHYYALDTDNDENKIVVTLFEGEPYNSWQIKALARKNGFQVQRSSKFEWGIFPEYHHRRTNSTKDTTKPANERDARVYVFEEAKERNLKVEKQSRDSDSE